MAYTFDNFNIYLNDLLNYQLVVRCSELNNIIDRCSIKELHDFFPILVNSVFGNTTTVNSPAHNSAGWGLRTITRQSNPNEFNVLYSFFIPLGPMFRLCYRLLNEPIKFEVPIEMLPARMSEMLYSGRYPQFYTDMINVDPTRRQIVSLSMNAFDYFLLHFTLHAMVPLHRSIPEAMAVHNEKWKTVYFFLTADYVCSFMPSHPDSIVLPSNICGSVKTSTVMPIQPIQPMRSPKYVKLSALTHSFTGNTNSSSPPNPRNSPTESVSRNYSWRTESALYLFIDTWLRFDVDEHRELPSSEFVRVVRILVKQLHAFANSADLDTTSMAPLRHIAQPMMNAQMYMFLRCMIKRWPLVSSFSVVLELWLSYIQPWRYTFERNIFREAPNAAQLQIIEGQVIQRRFEQFIKDNMVSYTQILVQLLPRFQLIDFSSSKNVQMLFRLLKVLGQANLSELLRANEFDVYATKSFISSSPKKHNTSVNRFGGAAQHSSIELMNDWGSYRTDAFEDNYVCMFGAEVKQQMQMMVEKMLISKEVEGARAVHLLREIRMRQKGIVQWIKRWLMGDEDVISHEALNDCRKIPELLDNMLQNISNIFDIELPDPAAVAAKCAQYSWDENQSFDVGMSADEMSDSNVCPSPSAMRKRQKTIKYTIDPAIVPIQSNEITFLVRFLHQFSSKLDIMFHNELNEYWHRDDVIGRITRQLLYPPMVVHSFDKSHGYSRACEDRKPARVNLRFLASYQTFSVILVSSIGGHIFFGAPSFGLLVLLLSTFLYLLVLSFINDPK